MDTDRLFQRAKQLIDEPISIVLTPELVEYIGAIINTPMGEGRIVKLCYSHTRRVNNKAYKLYTLTITIDTKQYHITTYEHTQWSIN